MKTTGLLAALVFIVGIVAAGAMESAGTTTAAARVAILAADADHTAATKSVRFTISVKTKGRQSVVVTGVEDFVGHAVEINVGPWTERFVGNAVYLHGVAARPLPAGKSWVLLSATPVRPDRPDASRFLTAVRAVRNIKVVGNPKLAGVDVTEYSASVDVARVAFLAGVDNPKGVTAKVWVDGSKRIRQLEIDLRTAGADQTTVLELSGFGRQSPVTAPPADQVVPEAQAPGYRQSVTAVPG